MVSISFLLVITNLLYFTNSATLESDLSNDTSLSRTKRSVAQLISLLYSDSPYKFTKLANYGNWCGKGGDRMGDGSYIDGCDLCCKYHDLCYHSTRMGFEGCNPIFTVYNYRHGEEDPDVDSKGISYSEERNLIRERKLPSCNTEENDAPSCKESTCQCDVDFIICLKKEPCDPSIVNEKSRYWWIPW